ncbi:protein kinase domain-containing protein [Gemmatimonas phototrophica]|uniref:protein kinase domain-containing protein n=1 Tax=Gemmatimonas phototrophica TaxID=1379270 RepID=UPI0006A71661|nr:protein kinase [Gemmatimonas phototrophica]
MSPIPERLITALADRYRIERELGAGGMATVYLAQDLKHDRLVAVKVLKPELAAVLGGERFVVEIKTTASMSHPHILPLFDSGTADGFLFYVMPFIDGETLRSKLDRETQLGIDDAVRIAREVLDALDYAHARGVIHRDIKPENILMQGGRPLIADFGIALAVSAAAGGRMTETGLSLGTPHYMSPEQATAEKEISGRSDVYSLASVLYEMLCGEPPHMGNSAQQIIMKIITEPAAAVTKYRKSVPGNVAAAVAKALEKLPADRFESAKAFAEALGNPAFALAATAAVGGAQASPEGRSRRLATVVASVVAVLALGAAAAGWMRTMPEEPFRRYDLTLGTLQISGTNDIAISPDGRTLALSAREGSDGTAIYVRTLDVDLGFRKLAGSESGLFPTFSPDGQWLAFQRTSDRSLVKIPVGGGGAVTVVPAGKLDPILPQWGHPDTIVFTGPTGVFRVPAAGGPVVPMPKVKSSSIFALPDGAGLLFAENDQVSYYDFAKDSVSVVLPVGDAPMYAPSGHLLFVSPEGGLFAVAFDLATHMATGTPVRVLERVGRTGLARGYAMSQNGVVVQRDAAANIGGLNVPVLVTLGGAHDTLRLPTGRRTNLRFSPDGRALAMTVGSAQRSGDSEIFTLDVNTRTYTQLTFDGDRDSPVWSPDGQRIAFMTRADSNPAAEDLFITFADNHAPARRITTLRSREIIADQWLDDTLLLFTSLSPERRRDILFMRPDSGSTPVPYLRSPENEFESRVSPDRRLLAYTSTEGGGDLSVWLRDFPTPVGKWAVSRGLSRAPRWSPDGRYLYYWRPSPQLDSLYRVRVDRTPSVVIQAPEFVVALDVDGVWNWDLHPDGKHFVYTAPVQTTVAGGGAAAVRYFILQGWFGELRRLTASGGK